MSEQMPYPPIEYHPHCILDRDRLFANLLDLDWLKVTPARSEYYVNIRDVPYKYGAAGFARTYHPQKLTPAIAHIWECVEILTDQTYDICFLNRYDSEHQQLGWHADDSPEMDDSKPIVIVSLGAEREIQFAPKNVSPVKQKTTLLLGNGSACIMKPGMQDTHIHRIPKVGHQVGTRISLTFRGYVQP